MKRTEILTNTIKEHITNKHFMTVETFREMFIKGLPGKLALLAISRNGEHVLPVFDTHTFFSTTDKIDYTAIRNELGTDWTPIVTAHIWNHEAGIIPQTLLATDGIIDEKVLINIFGNHFHWHNTIGAISAFGFGDFDITTLPKMAIYTIDFKGARRIKVANNIDDGKVLGIHLDTNGFIHHFDRETGKTMVAFMKIG
ncbi:MAG: hypothetical protein JRI55_31570, partial [Deltaproteobacteria bacterium]|nr:hypothetical protein [Deltaproteobacteria bacterium]